MVKNRVEDARTSSKARHPSVFAITQAARASNEQNVGKPAKVTDISEVRKLRRGVRKG